MTTRTLRAGKALNLRKRDILLAATALVSAINGTKSYEHAAQGTEYAPKDNALLVGTTEVFMGGARSLDTATQDICVNSFAHQSEVLCGKLADGDPSTEIEGPALGAAATAVLFGTAVGGTVIAAESALSAPGRFIGGALGQLYRPKAPKMS